MLRAVTILSLLLTLLGARGQGFDFADVAFLAAIEDDPAAGGGGGGDCLAVTNAMTVTRLAFTNTTTAANSYTTGQSYTPNSNSLVIATIVNSLGSSPIAPTTVTGNGLTWTKVAQTNYDTLASPLKTLSIWTAQGTPSTVPTAGQLTADFNGVSQTGCIIEVAEVVGAATNNNAIVQTILIGSNAVANPRIDWSAPGNNGSNAIFYAVADDVNSGTDNAPETGWTELSEGNYNTPATGLAQYYQLQVPAGTTFTTNIATARDWAAIALEIRAGTNCIPPPPSTPGIESFGETNFIAGFAIYTNIVTISGANRLLCIFPGGGDNTPGALTVTNITVGGPVGVGVAMTSNTIARSATWCGQNAYSLANPTSGSVTCYVYCLNSGADHFGIIWANVTNANQTTPIRHYTNGAAQSTAPSLVISSAANDLFISGLATDDDNAIAISVGGQVMQGPLIGGGPDFTRLAIATNSGAATSTITWTTDNEQWAKVGLSVMPP